jgi:hypothetical protein
MTLPRFECRDRDIIVGVAVDGRRPLALELARLLSTAELGTVTELVVFLGTILAIASLLLVRLNRKRK